MFQNQIRSTGSSRTYSGRNEVEGKLNSICIHIVGLETILYENSQQCDKARSGKLKDDSITNKQELQYTTQEKLEKIVQLE